MRELKLLDSDRYEIVCRLVQGAYDELVAGVISDIKALPHSCRQSGDDTNLKNVWEEYKYQVQGEPSVMFEVYAQVIRDICARRVQGIELNWQRLLWLWTQGYLELWADTDEISLDELNPNDVTAELYQRVAAVAGNERLEVDPDEERDRERFNEDRPQ